MPCNVDITSQFSPLKRICYRAKRKREKREAKRIRGRVKHTRELEERGGRMGGGGIQK